MSIYLYIFSIYTKYSTYIQELAILKKRIFFVEQLIFRKVYISLYGTSYCFYSKCRVFFFSGLLSLSNGLIVFLFECYTGCFILQRAISHLLKPPPMFISHVILLNILIFVFS